MEAGVQQWKMTTVKIPIVVNIFDRYKNKKIKWAGIFQIMTQRIVKRFTLCHLLILHYSDKVEEILAQEILSKR